ncbi:MAG: sulfatase-like hydrolase/transferase [Myxococcota bacterium]
MRDLFPALALLVAGCTPPGAPAPVALPPSPSNVLVLLTDDQGVDKVAAYGEHPDPPHTPRIDALARDGLLFRNAWATPSCSPTRAALLTGRTGRRTGVGGVLQVEEAGELPLDEVTLPRLLREAAPTPWATAALGKWHLSGYAAPDGVDHPVRAGFDVFRGSMGNLYDVGVDDGQRHSYYHWDKVSDGALAVTERYATSDTVDDALALAAELPEPWLLYVAFNAPHRPLDPPPEALHTLGPLTEDSPEAVRYQAVVEALDTEIGRLLDGLDPAVRERTTVIFASDNGTPEHAVLPPWSPSRGKDTPFEGGINVPLVVSGPLVAAPGTETDALVQLLDVFATVADIAGVPASALDGVALDSRSLLPLLRGEPDPQRAFVHSEQFNPPGPGPYVADWRMTRGARFKVVTRAERDALFDLAGRDDDGPVLDPAALPAEVGAEVDALLAEHARYWAEIPPFTGR